MRNAGLEEAQARIKIAGRNINNLRILKEISPGCSLEGLILKLKLQYFGHLMWRADSFEKTLMLGKIEGGGEGDDRGWDGWMASPTQWTWVWVDSGSWWWTGRPVVLQFMGSQRVGHDWATELNWTELKHSLGLLSWLSDKESTCQGRRCGISEFDLWVMKIPWSKKWQPTPAVLPRKFRGQRSLEVYSLRRLK